MPNFREIAKTLRGQKYPVRFLAGLVLHRTGLCRAFKIRHSDFTIPFHYSSYALPLWTNPDYHAEEFAFLRAYLRPGDVAIDAGANIGALTLAASRAVGPSGRVMAVEAHPRVFELLTSNVAANGRTNVLTYNVALGAAEGAVRFEDRRDDDTANRVLAGEDRGGVEVRMVRLDALVAQTELPSGGPVALLKVDVEGYERFVIEGATDTLSRTRCVYFEASDLLTAPYGYPASAIFALRRDQGFSFLRAEGAGRVSRFGGGGAVDYGNFFAVPNEGEFCERTGTSLLLSHLYWPYELRSWYSGQSFGRVCRVRETHQVFALTEDGAFHAPYRDRSSNCPVYQLRNS